MDILVYAIQMELDGEQYYTEQAAINRSNSLKTVFKALANDESNHARLLEEKSKGLCYGLNTRVHPSAQNVFANIKDFAMEIKKVPEQVDAYRLAMEKEKKSIELYKGLLAETADCRDLYEFLIAEEEEHYKMLEDIIEMVNRPNNWVEAAEFGNREPY